MFNQSSFGELRKPTFISYYSVCLSTSLHVYLSVFVCKHKPILSLIGYVLWVVLYHIILQGCLFGLDFLRFFGKYMCVNKNSTMLFYFCFASASLLLVLNFLEDCWFIHAECLWSHYRKRRFHDYVFNISVLQWKHMQEEQMWDFKPRI